MKANKMMQVIFVFCLLASLPALAQQNLVMPPPATQAIDKHLQQSRTQKQREALRRESAASLPPRQAAHNKPSSSKTDAVTAKPKIVSHPTKTVVGE